MSETHIALCSGGRDSAVATHAAMRFGPAEFVVYLDTTTGLDQNREYVEQLCDEYGWHLATWRTNYNYEDVVRQYGFPGPGWHSKFYRRLKERQLAFHARRYRGEVHFWTGMYKEESKKRMARTVERDDGKDDLWIWRAPMANWSEDDFDSYVERFDLPRNQLWQQIGRSGDCYCGAYGNRMELIDVDAIDGEISTAIRDLESKISVDECEFDDPRREEWAWHDDKKEAWAMEDEQQMTLCSHCGIPEQEYPSD